jgi:nephrocystin-4
VALAHLNAHPQSMTPDDEGNLPLPDIVERRIQIGLHNSQTFLHAPIITTLNPVYSDYVGGDGFELTFNGNIELDKYLRENSGMAVVFVVEYKVLIMTNEEKKMKSSLGALLERLTLSPTTKTPQKIGVEKIITVGWGSWNPMGNTGNE